MITFIAHLHVPPENAAAFEELMTYVVAMTNEHEPGVAYYGFAKSVERPTPTSWWRCIGTRRPASRTVIPTGSGSRYPNPCS